ncbi:MAG: hypothetical protein ABIT38_02230, partial [Gemmatimonadaceae bacterium]
MTTAMRTIIRIPAPWIAALSLLTVACKKDTTDAYGNFEATEVTVASEATGRLLRLTADEGMRLRSGDVVAVVDTESLVLQRRELGARREAQRSRGREVDANAAALETQRVIAQREL